MCLVLIAILIVVLNIVPTLKPLEDKRAGGIRIFPG